ncbi:hypothetical protein [Fischerella thermalis]
MIISDLNHIESTDSSQIIGGHWKKYKYRDYKYDYKGKYRDKHYGYCKH